MNSFLLGYTALWVLYCAFAAGIAIRERASLSAELRTYLRFLCVPWKLAVFAPALLFVTFAGRFTNDETWDIATGGVMSILTFLTAPWVVGVLYQVVKGKRTPKCAIVAIALCLFSCSWFYDSYLFLRDGHYTSRWLGNLMLSPFLYALGGLLWNLEAKGAWPTLSFLRPDWPAPSPDRRFAPLLIVAFLLIISAGVILVSFVSWHW
jgi:hypothetical protein